ncbi:MAG: hypothetical protein NZM31_04400 [Gemmatales bacterium]|nr:hypothetical protein [Gemmatales bacterium]MDW8386242.1 hypothetical protein [Gemmatales bacterium]
MHENLEKEIRAIYAEAEADIAQAGPICQLSGRCCRFKEHGHTLFLSNLEAAVLLKHAPAYDQPVSEEGCPFQRGKLCTVRDHRPLGCRVYYCDPAYQETGQTISEKYLRRLKALADQYGVPWRYAPLHAFLNHEVETIL